MGMVTKRSDTGLAPIQGWQMGMGRSIWLDLGVERAMGLGTIPLWHVVSGRPGMELVPGPIQPVLVARRCELQRLQGRYRLGAALPMGSFIPCLLRAWYVGRRLGSRFFNRLVRLLLPIWRWVLRR